MVIYSQHFCVLIYAQNDWKEKDYESITEKTFTDFMSGTAHADCDVCLTCPVCRANWELFNPENPGEYIQFCEFCEVLLPLMKDKLTSDGMILFSHSLLNLDALKQFVEYSLKSKKIKKIFVLEQDDYVNKKRTKPNKLSEQIKQQEISCSKFVELITSKTFEYNVLYEIFKDKYY
ncbi:MAG: hypothetical protein FK734_08985 [Asgard group archaeon]|nr:hypothetical protein [Asgard group archaeon]